MTVTEQALRFDCQGESLVGILCLPAGAYAALGVVVVVGGPQVRVGSHRQFLLLSRRLAAAGYAVLRFDVRGMGDSTGEFPGFEHLGPDLAAAAAALRAHAPGVRQVALWGLCDAASAALLHAAAVPGLAGLVLLNPWVRHADTQVRVELRQYYARRVLDPAFWRKLLGGQVRLLASVREFAGKLWRALRARTRRTAGDDAGPGALAGDYRERMAVGALTLTPPQFYILAGNDHVSAEFLAYCDSHARLARLWQRDTVTRLQIPEADHTFSSAALRRQVEDATLQWLRALEGQQGSR